MRSPTCCPGYQLVPLCRTRISPAFTYCSPNRFTPRRRPALLRLFFVDPPPRFVAVRIWMAWTASSTDVEVRPASGDSADEVEAVAEAAKREKRVSIAGAWWWASWCKGERRVSEMMARNQSSNSNSTDEDGHIVDPCEARQLSAICVIMVSSSGSSLATCWPHSPLSRTGHASASSADSASPPVSSRPLVLSATPVHSLCC